MTPMEVYPTPLAFLIADTVIEDVQTRKKSIIGLFNSICSPHFPFRHPEMNLFIGLTDGHGEYASSLICSRGTDEVEVFRTSGTVEFQSPNAVVEIHFTLRNIEFVQPGKYSFQFFCNDKLLILRPFEVLQVTPNGVVK